MPADCAALIDITESWTCGRDVAANVDVWVSGKTVCVVALDDQRRRRRRRRHGHCAVLHPTSTAPECIE